MMKIEKNILYSLFFVFASHSACSAHPSVTIQYAPQTTNDTAPALSKVFFYNEELSHITLSQLTNEKHKNIVENQEALLKGWNRTYLAQTALYLTAGAAFIAHYINGDNIATFKENNIIAKNIGAISPIAYKIAIPSALLIAALPIKRYYKLFTLKDIAFWYPHEEVDGTIVIFRRKTFSHSKVYGNTVIHYYDISNPIGYMTLNERDNALSIAEKASRRMHLSLLNAVLCGAGLIWVAAR